MNNSFTLFVFMAGLHHFYKQDNGNKEEMNERMN